jgi:hypothetical protein
MEHRIEKLLPHHGLARNYGKVNIGKGKNSAFCAQQLVNADFFFPLIAVKNP